MTLPAPLAKYDGLIDLLVELLVRDIETGGSSAPDMRKPALPTKRTRALMKDEHAYDITPNSPSAA